MAGMARIADHLQLDDSIEDLDCFPVMTEAALLSLDAQLSENKLFQAQLVIIVIHFILIVILLNHHEW